MMNNIQQILEKALLLIKNNDCKGQINVFSVENKNASFSSGKLEQLSEGEQGSVGIKIISKEGKIATSTTNILSEKGINRCRKAIQMVKYTQPDEAHDVSDEEEFTYIDWAFDVDTKNMSLNEVMELAQNLEQKAKKAIQELNLFVGQVMKPLTRIYFANNGLYKNALFTNAALLLVWLQ